MFFLFLLFSGLYFAREFLIPLTIAGLLAMLFLPLSKKLEKRKIGRGWAALLSILVLLVFIAGVIALLSWQMSDIAKDADQMKQHLQENVDKATQAITNKFGISAKKQQEFIEKQQSQGSGGGQMMMGFVSGLSGMIVNFILVLVYLFLLLYFRSHLKTFALKLTKQDQKAHVQKVIYDCSLVAQKYLGGLGAMIVMLWIMYGIGFSIVGVKNALFFAVLCGILEIVPFVGNVIGTSLTLLMVLTQGGGSGMLLGVIITYGIVQFVQTYLLEPLIVGAEVNINPLFTIMILVLGELIWGLPGMILAIPLLGIVKIVCDNVEGLKPYGYLIGKEKKEKQENSVIDKIKKWFK